MRAFAGCLLGISLALAAPLAAAEELPGPPEIKTLHYKIVSRIGEDVRETIVDAQSERWRVDSVSPEPKSVVLSFFDPETTIVTDFRLDAAKAQATRKARRPGANPKDGERVFRECYPAVWQTLLDNAKAGMKVVHTGSDKIGGKAVEVYSWINPVNDMGRKWLMAKRDGGWIPVRCIVIEKTRESQVFEFSDVKINASMEDGLFAIPESFSIVEPAS